MKKEIINFLRCSQCHGENISFRADILTCSKCGKKYPVVSEKIFYNEPPEIWPKSRNPNPSQPTGWSKLRKGEYKFTSKILSEISPNSVIFDLGAGESHFRDLLSRFKEVLSVDLFPYQKIDVVADFTKEVPLRDSSGDIVVISNVLEHIIEPQFFLNECVRVLKSGGTIVGTAPFLLWVHQEPYDYNRFTDFMLKHILEEAGFTDVRVESVVTSLDTLKSLTGRYFEVIKDNNKDGGVKLSVYDRIRLSLVLRLEGLQQRLLSAFSALPSSKIYTAGYGFTGRKK